MCIRHFNTILDHFVVELEHVANLSKHMLV